MTLSIEGPLTDPVAEFKNSASYLLSKKEEFTGKTIDYAFRQIITPGTSHLEVTDSYSILFRKSLQVAALINDLESGEVTIEEIKNANDALNSIVKILQSTSSQKFDRALEDHVAGRLGALDPISREVRKKYPLKVISSSQLKEARKRLEQSDESLRNAGVPLYLIEPTLTACEQLQFAIRNFHLFGHELAIEKAMLVQVQAVGLLHGLEQKGARLLVVSALSGFVFVADVIDAPQKYVNAYEWMKKVSVEAIDYVSKATHEQPKIENRKQNKDEKHNIIEKHTSKNVVRRKD